MPVELTDPLVAASRWKQITATWPMRTALLAVTGVWLLGCAWSFHEQSAFAASKGFAFPHLLPLVIDGLAVAMAGVSWAASLDARPAIPARLATLVAVAGSAASNGTWAWIRTSTPAVAAASGHDRVAVALGVAVPVAANLAFEVLLAELRRQVQRGRGLPPPAAIPQPRLIRVTLAPWTTLREWRALVLEVTRPVPAALLASQDSPAPVAVDRRSADQDEAGDANRSAPVTRAPSISPPSTATTPPTATVNPAPNDVPSSGVENIPDDHPGTPATDTTDAAITAPRSRAHAPRLLELVSRAPATRPTAPPARSSHAAGAAGKTDPPLSQPSPSAPPVSGDQKGRDPRVEQLLTLLREGEQLTGVQAARVLECSDRTGRRLLRIAQERHDRGATPQDDQREVSGPDESVDRRRDDRGLRPCRASRSARLAVNGPERMRQH